MAALRCVRVNVTTGVFLSAMTYSFVTTRELRPNAAVGSKFVGNDTSLSVHFLANRRFQCFRRNVWHDTAAKLSVPLDSTEYWCLARTAPTLAGARVARFTRPDIDFIAFHCARQLGAIWVWSHSKANAIHHKQG